MKAYFLEAQVPLTKTFTLENGELKKIGHPRIVDYTSHEEQYDTLEQFTQLLVKHAKSNHCLLKGGLTRPLQTESRAGTTDPSAATRILCLDLDGARGFDTPNDFLKAIELHDIDHVIQYSASMGVDPDRGLSAHIFMLLDREIAPALLKQWLMHINLTNPTLRAGITLTRTSNALRWPLDISTCQNDKLIYIAPPICEQGVVDGFKGKRIQFVKRTRRALTLVSTANAEINKRETELVLAKLREQAGLPKRRKTELKIKQSVEYMPNPDKAIVTGIKRERGFIYLNLNGGDSWGYYHPENNPRFIFNFKSEPAYLTQELLPDYWAEINSRTESESSSGHVYLAFRDFKTGSYWNGVYHTETKHLQLSQARTKTQLIDFMKQHGQPVGDFIPDWSVVFDPHLDAIVDIDNKIVNLYEPSTFMRMAPKPNRIVPPTITRVIKHALGNDDDAFEHFMNWLACIAQYKCRTMTAWVLHGTQGTGKGVMLHRILAPIFGERYVVTKRMEELDSQFNAYMEHCFILLVDEAQMSALQRSKTINASLKNYIVEPRISIRRMHTTAFMAENFMNLIFASNMPDPVIIDPEDRRFNVALFQPTRLELTPAEFDALDSELELFYHYLMTRTADREKARIPLNNSAKQQMANMSRASIDFAIEALQKGDLQFFIECLPSDTTILARFDEDRANNYKALLERIVKDEPTAITRDELFVLLDYVVGGMPRAPHKFTNLLKYHKCHIETVWRNGKSQRGVKVHWKTPQSLEIEHEKAVHVEEQSDQRTGPEPVLRTKRGRQTPSQQTQQGTRKRPNRRNARS